MGGFNPIRRSPIKPKAKKHKESAPWRAPKIRLDAPGMYLLRGEVFARAGFQCENHIDGKRCKAKIGWFSFNLHHVQHRSLGGSDCLENSAAVCWTCHDLHHSGKRRIET